MDPMQDVKKFLDAFLDSPNPGVIAIKGDWGAGKLAKRSLGAPHHFTPHPKPALDSTTAIAKSFPPVSGNKNTATSF